jgi:hypothetical protein
MRQVQRLLELIDDASLSVIALLSLELPMRMAWNIWKERNCCIFI